MKLVRPISAIPLLLLSLTVGLFALQRGGYGGYSRYYTGQNVLLRVLLEPPSVPHPRRRRWVPGSLRRRLGAGLSQSRQ